MTRRSALLTALVAAVALGVTACSSDTPTEPEETSPTAEEPSPEATEDEVVSITIGALPISETAPLWAAIDAGVFAEHGLDVTVEAIQGGALAMPALVNGDVDFLIGQPYGALRAHLQDLDVRIIANYASSYAEGDDINGVVSAPGSDISRPADLAGKRVAVNSLGAAGDLTISAVVAQDGGDPSTIEFVEVAFPDAKAQLEAGNIDAAWVPQPFLNMIVGAGGTLVTYNYQDTLPGLPTLVIIATGATVNDDPDLVNRVRDAFSAAFAWAADNDDAVRQALVDNLSIPPEGAAALPLPRFDTTLDVQLIQDLADLAAEFGFFESAPDVADIVAQ
ncbi:MAG: ABC transporter substrate-binding protein [Actinomycetales bacterium]|nr:ABC transporter substrate-binding protein [Actinomycetales bacterium]